MLTNGTKRLSQLHLRLAMMLPKFWLKFPFGALLARHPEDCALGRELACRTADAVLVALLLPDFGVVPRSAILQALLATWCVGEVSERARCTERILFDAVHPARAQEVIGCRFPLMAFASHFRVGVACAHGGRSTSDNVLLAEPNGADDLTFGAVTAKRRDADRVHAARAEKTLRAEQQHEPEQMTRHVMTS